MLYPDSDNDDEGLKQFDGLAGLMLISVGLIILSLTGVLK